MRKKKKAVLAIVLTAALMIGIMPAKIALADTYGMTGSGTASDPYIIKTAQQLANIPNVSLTAYYALGADINCTTDGISPWVPLCYESSNMFSGCLDGRGHTFTYPSHVSAAYSFGYYGIFSQIFNATIKNLNVEGPIYDQGSTAGAIAGYAESSMFTNCKTDCTITANDHVGGMVGQGYDDVYNNCVSHALIQAVGSYAQCAGGLVGDEGHHSTGAGAQFNNCSSSSVVNYGAYNVGGLAGSAEDAVFTGCSFSGNVKASVQVCGGIVGALSFDKESVAINKCYTTDSSVESADMSVGGLVGSCGNADIENSYSMGTVTGCASGGIAGYVANSINSGRLTIYNCYSVAAVTVPGGGSACGGIAGQTVRTNIADCYSAGAVSGGGVIGSNIENGSDQSCLTHDYYNSGNENIVYQTIAYSYAPNVTACQGYASSYMQTSDFTTLMNSARIALEAPDALPWVAGGAQNSNYPALNGVGVGADTTPPAGSYSLSKSNWTCKPVTITVNATDTGSGVASITLPNSTVVSAATATYTVTDNGTYNFVLADNAGNSCTYPVTVSNIDKAVSVTHDQTVAYTIDPNSSTLSGGTITLTNNDPHIGVAVYLNSLSTSGIAAVAPDAIASWNALNTAQTASSMAIAVGVSNAANTDWYSVARSAPAYSTDLASPVLIGIIKPGSSVTLNLFAKYGLSWASQKAVTHTLALSYQACDTD